MEAVARGQDAEAAGATSGKLDGGLDRFSAAVGEDDVSKSGRATASSCAASSPCAAGIDVMTRFGSVSRRTLSSACQIGSGSWPNGTAPNCAMQSA